MLCCNEPSLRAKAKKLLHRIEVAYSSCELHGFIDQRRKNQSRRRPVNRVSHRLADFKLRGGTVPSGDTEDVANEADEC